MFTLDYTSIFLILLNVFVFILFLFLIYAIFVSYRSSNSVDQVLLRQDAYKKALATLDTARDEALRLVKETEYLTDDTKTKLKKEFNTVVTKLSDQLAADLTATIKDEGSRGVESIRNASTAIEQSALSEIKKFEGVSKTMESEALHELENFKNELHESTLHNEEAVQLRLSKEYEEMARRIETYEQGKMSQIDKKIAGIMLQVTQELFDKSIDVSTSEQMVMEALSKAKRENMFV